ncbi:hypothetical protein [Virgibacillus kimchii]
MKQTVRSFSIGLLTAGIVMLVGFYFFDSGTGQTKELTVEEMVPLVEEEGYRIISEQDYISLSVGNNEPAEEEGEEANEESNDEAEEADESAEEEENTEDNNSNGDSGEEENEEEEEITTYTLNIESGMTTSEFSSLLEENDIIEDAGEFNQYIEDEDYSLRVQIGEFELTSDMSMYEIAEEITR